MKLQLVAVLALSALTAVASEESHTGMVSDKEFVALSELKNAERSSPLEGLSDKPVIREISGETFRALASKPGYKTHLQMSFEDGTDGLVSERRFSTLRNPEGFEHVRTYVERPEFSEHNVRTVAERPFSSGAVEHFYNNDRPVEGEFSDVRVFNKHHPIESVPAYLQRASIREIPDFAGSAVREVPVGRRFEGNFAPQSRVFESTYEPQEFVNKFEGPVSKSFVESSFVPKSRYIESSFGPKTRYIESSFGPKTRYIESRSFA